VSVSLGGGGEEIKIERLAKQGRLDMIWYMIFISAAHAAHSGSSAVHKVAFTVCTF
jgi:hypothetical protein